MRRRVKLGVEWALAALAVACASPGSQRIVGPDGSPMAHVHCGADQGICFRIAGELCPNGYDIQPVMSGSEGNFLVRCHGARLPPVVAAAPSAVAPPAGWASAHTPPAPSSGSGEHWPPANEPWPNAYPWPPPETSAATQPPAPNAPSAAGTKAEINLGF